MATSINPFESDEKQDVPDDVIRNESRANAPSEYEPLLNKYRTPPPRYSTIETTTQPDGYNNDIAGVHNAGFFAGGTAPNVEFFPQTQPNPGFNSPTNQIGGHTGWYPYIPGPALYFPPGLEHLDPLDEVTITGHGSRYRIWQDDGHKIFKARVTHEGWCGRRKIEADFRVLNNANLEVLCLTRTQDDGDTRCCGPATEHLEIAFPRGPIVGVVQGSKAEYTVHNPSGDLLFILERERGGCCRDDSYEITSADGFGIGRISVQRSCCGSSKTTIVLFPGGTNALSKGLLLSAALSIKDLHGL
ncbi:phospholipid scramblase 1-like [Palaemon carinicauda]|uniref:phospholipid scramblase 1-like n=1 Tax=Palaemon carinicauda TaxID=392227 RepID=UPI0035B67D33